MASDQDGIRSPGSQMWDVLLYMCSFYWLMNKAVLTNGLTEKSQAGKHIYREKVESKRYHISVEGEKCQKTLPVGYSLVLIHRLIEMG